jgi:hypothetical protein
METVELAFFKQYLLFVSLIFLLCFYNFKITSYEYLIFLLKFIKYMFYFGIKFSYYYFNFVLIVFGFFKLLFFANMAPIILQTFLTFHFFLDLIWVIYLHLLLISILYFSLPLYLFDYIRQKRCFSVNIRFCNSFCICLLVFVIVYFISYFFVMFAICCVLFTFFYSISFWQRKKYVLIS